MITEEIYKPIPGCEYIEVSNLGNVRKTDGFFKIGESKGRPYPYIVAQKELLGRIFRQSIHTIVADLFLGRQEEIKRRNSNLGREKVIVCHIDDDPRNNRADNLYLGTPRSNAQDLIRNRQNALL